MKELKQITVRQSFWMALGYVCTGLLALLLSRYNLPEAIKLVGLILVLLTFPVFFFAFLILWEPLSPYYLIPSELVLFFLVWYFAYGKLLKVNKRKEIFRDLQFIKETFGEVEYSSWNFKEPLRWIFSFSDRERNKLFEFQIKLSVFNYELVELTRTETGWKLKMVKNDILTPADLARRNQFFEELIVKNKLESYDGWDVERLN